VLLPLQGLVGARTGMRGPFASDEKIALYWLNSAVLGALAGVVVWAWWLDGGDLAALGLGRAPLPGTPWWILALAACGWALDAAWKLAPAHRAETARRLRERVPFLPETRRELAHSLAMVLGSAVFEEVLWRGFAIAWLAAVLSPPAAVLVRLPALFFAAGHAYQGPGAVLEIAALAALFGWFYLGAGVLWPLFVAHGAIDALGMVLAVRLVRTA